MTALTFLAYALPRRCAVWWAAQCLHAAGSSPTPEEGEVLSAAEQWVREPNDANRRRAMQVAQAQSSQTACCWPAIAAFWSFGSIAPPDCPPVSAADHLCGKAVAGAVSLAGVITEPERAQEKQRRYIDLALAIAAGEEHWT
jgi:hypothetical protein